VLLVLLAHGTPLGGGSNVALYKQIAKELLGRGRSAAAQDGQWLPAVNALREVLFKLVVAIKASGETGDLKEVERLRDVAHYLGMHAMCKAKTGDLKEVERLRDEAHYLGIHAMCKAEGGAMAEMENNLALSLIRYCDVLPADRVFYEAGQSENNLALSRIRYCDVLPVDRVIYEAGQPSRLATSERPR
ncbi:hypothetical protein T484DRAFT_1771009, partial [Baffinella frigidus]